LTYGQNLKNDNLNIDISSTSLELLRQ